jgi:hypothetical protein
MSLDNRKRRLRIIAVIAAAALLASTVITTIVLVQSTNDDSEPAPPDLSPTLTLSRTSNVYSGELASAAGLGGYRLAGSLSADTSTQGVVIDASRSSVTRDQVNELLDALGVDARPEKVDGGWTARGTAAGEPAAFALDETAGNVWQFARGEQADCLTIAPGGNPDTGTCSIDAPPPGEAGAKGPGRESLLRTADGVFDLVGIRPGEGLNVQDSGGVTYLDVPLTVEGLPVVDATLSVAADDAGLVSGFGWLTPSFATVGRYPLTTQQDAYERLLAQPVPEIARACPEGEVCPEPTAQPVTAVRLAWLTSRDSGRSLLVPAWQFEVDGFYGPAVVAIPDRYLAAPPTDDGSNSGGGSGSSGGDIGTGSTDPVAPADPGTPEPAPGGEAGTG